MKEKITDILLAIYYNEMFPMEDYQTAEYISGRRERAIERYKIDGLFSTKVDIAVAQIMQIVREMNGDKE